MTLTSRNHSHSHSSHTYVSLPFNGPDLLINPYDMMDHLVALPCFHHTLPFPVHHFAARLMRLTLGFTHTTQIWTLCRSSLTNSNYCNQSQINVFICSSFVYLTRAGHTVGFVGFGFNMPNPAQTEMSYNQTISDQFLIRIMRFRFYSLAS